MEAGFAEGTQLEIEVPSADYAVSSSGISMVNQHRFDLTRHPELAYKMEL